MNQSKIVTIDFHSKALNKKMSMKVYLPEVHARMAPLPVLYFLHGRSGNETTMFDAKINAKADRMINDEKIQPMIIVCPRIENSRGLNSSLICREMTDPVNQRWIVNLGMYEDYFLQEVVPLVDRTFDTVKDREGRFIGGASAGGYAALLYAFRYQHMFSKAGGHMPALELELQGEDKPYYESMDHWDKYNPITIARNNSISAGLSVYLDAGDKDEGRFYEGCAILHEVLKGKGVPSQNHIFPGNHSVEYIKVNIENYLEFYGR
jgi:enterochelin esterase-like enzyme